MTKPITGHYECQHSSGIGLDYFTSRIDRLTIQPDGRFVLIVQDRSRLAGAAQSLVKGQQVTTTAQETKREGRYYTQQGNILILHFDDGAQDQGQIAWNGEGIQIGQNFFNKVSDSTFLPPTHRMKKDMDDIAKGLKIAGTIGGIAMKAAKTIQETIQTTQNSADSTSAPQRSPQAPAQQEPHPKQTTPSPQAVSQRPAPPPPPPPTPIHNAPAQEQQVETLFCDQCGARTRPGKRFCNNCGARLF